MPGAGSAGCGDCAAATVLNMRYFYLALLVWQPTWLVLLPRPAGYRSAWLAGLAVLILLPPLAGIWRRQYRAEIWGAYIGLLFFMVAVMEGWANPAARLAALLQIVLVLGYWLMLILLARQNH